MSHAPRWLAGVLLSLTLIAAEAAASERLLCASGDEAASIAILVVDYQRVPRHVWTRAEAKVTQVYRSIALETTWQRIWPDGKNQPSVPLAGDDRLWLSVVIPSPVMAARRVDDENELGVAPYAVDDRGRLAYVFYDRIETVARQSAVDTSQVLAYVVAHEIGHMLLPAGAHSDDGIMRGRLDGRTLRPAVFGTSSFFSPDQVDLMRGGVACE